jgi:hypothetical protein
MEGSVMLNGLDDLSIDDVDLMNQALDARDAALADRRRER